MRFMMLVIPKGYEKAAADFVPPADLVAKMDKYNESLAKAGVVLGLDGLHPPAGGARVGFAGGNAEAIEWAKRAPMQDGDIIEVRQVWELSDFPPDFQKAAGR